MSIWDWFTGGTDTTASAANLYPDTIPTASTAASSQSEADYIRSLGQTPPTDVTYEGPSTRIDPQEQKILFPRGLPSEAHSGALAELARASSQQPPPQQPPQMAPSGGGSQVSAPSGRGSDASRVWNTTDRTAIAKMAREYRQEGAYGSLGHSIGTIIKILASMGAGAAAAGAGAGAGAGAAAGAGGSASAAGGAAAGAAPAAGTAAGASSGATSGATTGADAAGGSFSSGFWQGVQGQQGSGWGNYLGQLARKEGQSMLQSSMSGGGGGGGGGGGTPGGAAGVQAWENKYTYGSSTEPEARTAQQLLEMHLMTPEKAWANQILADQTDALVQSDIPWA